MMPFAVPPCSLHRRTHHRRALHRRWCVPCLLLCSAVAACGSQPRAETASQSDEATAPPSADAASSTPLEPQVNGKAAAERSALRDGEDAAAEGAETEHAEDARSSATEPPELARAQASFDEALNPDRLSCSGARPRLEAICAIAERLCDGDDADLTSSDERECSQAREACRNAQERYSQKCS